MQVCAACSRIGGMRRNVSALSLGQLKYGRHVDIIYNHIPSNIQLILAVGSASGMDDRR
jgi:hypothetical protein